jgi:hypothetical protein
MTRPIYRIAAEIMREWKNPNYAAIPYLEAMVSIGDINEMYYSDTAKSVVLYFLANASTWRGPVARRIKAELKEMVK